MPQDKPFETDLIDKEKIEIYIEKLQKHPYGAHPFLKRMYRGIKHRKKNPSYYYLT